MRTFKKVLDGLARKSGVFSEIKVRMILDSWEEIIDPPLNKKVKPVALKGGVLYLLCRDPIWAQELRFYKEDILTKLKSRLSDIREVDSIKIVRRSEDVAKQIYS